LLVIKIDWGRLPWRRLITAVLSMVLLESRLNLCHQADATTLLVVQKSATNPPQKSFTCPQQLPELTTLLLRDLPAYSNRIIQRTQDLNQAAGNENYIITASKAEFEPLALPRLSYDQSQHLGDHQVEQVFFTVSERQYIQGKIIDTETYHWLFLTLTHSGWRTVMLFSRFGNSQAGGLPTPPQETTNGIIGRGVQLWLRDCRAGTVSLRQG
jgi:hypothetical protein